LLPEDAGVGWKTALRVSTFLACTRRARQKREEAFDHPLYDLLDFEPLQFKETLAVHRAVTNNVYAFKNVVRGEIKELIPIIPTHVQPSDRRPYYVVTAPDGSQENFTTDEILHIRGLSWDGLCYLEAVQLLQEPLGFALATESTHAIAACARRAAQQHHLGRQELCREGARASRRLGEEAL
jgi:hypothetical protein